MEQQLITNGGVQFVPQIAVQYVYLDFDGELTSYNGEILTIDNVEVQASALTEERIANILAELNARYAAQNVIFLTERPETAEYSTIYIGKTSAFDEYGKFAGLAETIDSGNKNKTDKAFVMLDSTNSNEKIISTISHETDHLLGALDHGGSGLAAYADRYVGYGISSYGVTLYGGSMFISSRGNATSTTISAGGKLYISGGGFATITRLAGGSIYLYSGGSAANTSVEWGTMHISGGYAYSTTISSSGCLYVSNGGTAKINVVDGGKMYICSGGTATSTYVNYISWVNSRLAGGELHICNGAIADGIWNGGRTFVSAGGTAKSAYIIQGYMYVSAGGSAINTSIHSEGKMIISSGGTATGINAKSGAALHIAVAPDTYIQGSYAGSSFFMQNAQIYNYTVNQRCQMDIFNGGCHKGSLNIAKGGVVSAYQGSVIEFTLTDSTSSSGYLINNLSAISGTPTYTIVLSANQQDGIYKLAQGANNFDGSITVSDGSSNYGSVKVNGTSLVYRDKHYSLKQSNGNLTLTIGVPDTTPPSKPTASANITSPTNSNVIVIANFSYDSEIRQYSYNNSDWYDYTTGIELSSNGTVYFRGVDAAGNISSVTTYTVNNIDKEKPTLRGTPTVTVNGTRADFTWDSASDNAYIAGYYLTVDGNKYSVDGTSYTLNNLSLGSHTFTLSAYDAAGNESYKSASQSFTINKQVEADTTAPTISSVSLTQGTNNYIFIAAVSASDNKTVSANLTYQIKYAATESGLNNAVAKSGNSFVLDADAAGQTYYYQVGVTDEAGNTAWSTAQSFTINKQVEGDTVAPTIYSTNLVQVTDSYRFQATVNASDNKTASANLTYQIKYATTENGLNNAVVRSGNSFVLDADAAGQTYYYQVGVTDEAGNTAWSTVQSFYVEEKDDGIIGTNSSLIVTTTEDVVDANDGVTSLREAITAAKSSASHWEMSGKTLTVTFADSLFSDSDCVMINLKSTLVNWDDTNTALKISGRRDGKNVILNGNNNCQIITGSRDATLVLNNLTFTGGYSADGGVVKTERGTVIIDNCTFTGNNAYNGGGVACNWAGKIFILNSTLANNMDKYGGDVFNYDGHGNASGTAYISVVNTILMRGITDYWGSRGGVILHDAGNLYGKSTEISDIFEDIGGEYLQLNEDGTLHIKVDGEAAGNGVYIWHNDNYSAIAYSTTYYGEKISLLGDVSQATLLSTDQLGNTRNQDKTDVGAVLFHLKGNCNGISLSSISGNSFVVEYSSNNFSNSLRFMPTTDSVDTYGMPAGTYQWRGANGGIWYNGNNITVDITSDVQKFISDADGNMDVFFAKANGTWEIGYAAQHTGILNGWSGTNEQVTLYGKNKLADIFEGSSDANILIMTDDTNGDALFVDDIYTALPGTVDEQQARIAQIDEIRAGLGDDIVDMTSQRFAYVGDGVKIYGGLGNDTIWSNNGSNILFGDAGNDRLVGGSDNDWIVGGVGNDTMHGGGGDDIFCFGGNFGTDTVEQLAGGEITLWFESGSADNWNADTLTYTDGTNSVTVSGVNTVTLKFGADVSLPDGCFADAASEKIFEDKNSGMLA